jgi:hypothetical protein
LWDISGALLLEHFNFSNKTFLNLIFVLHLLKIQLKGLLKMLKSQTKVHKSAQNRFLDDILADNPGTK